MTNMLKFATIASAALVAATLPLNAADARERHGRAQVQTARGAASGESTVTRTPGARSRNATWTGANGKTTSVTDERTRNRAEGTASRDHTRTFGNGDTRSVETDAQRTAPGQYDATRTVTGRNGETRTQTGEFAVDKTADGRAVTGQIQTQNAGAVDYSKTVTRGEGARTVSSSATFEDGTTRTRDSNGTCTQGAGCASQTTLVNRAGETTTIDRSRAKTEAGYEKSRTTTFADGTTRAVDVNATATAPGAYTGVRTVTGRNGETRTQTGEVEIERKP